MKIEWPQHEQIWIILIDLLMKLLDDVSLEVIRLTGFTVNSAVLCFTGDVV